MCVTSLSNTASAVMHEVRSCDICHFSGGQNGLQELKECQMCGVLVHPECYGLSEDKAVDNFICLACEAVGQEFEVGERGNDGRHVRVCQVVRPTECVLCSVDAGVHAMHPLYDTHGNCGRPILLSNPNRMAWVHTLCASVVAIKFGYVYGCTSDGSYESNNEAEVYYNNSRFEGREPNPKLENIDDNSVHHYVYCSQTVNKYKRRLREQRSLKCTYCAKDDSESGVLRIPIQCSCGSEDEFKKFATTHKQHVQYCTQGFHVGCATWTKGGERKNNPQRTFFNPGGTPVQAEPMADLYCLVHAKDIQTHRFRYYRRRHFRYCEKSSSCRDSVVEDVEVVKCTRTGGTGNTPATLTETLVVGDMDIDEYEEEEEDVAAEAVAADEADQTRSVTRRDNGTDGNGPVPASCNLVCLTGTPEDKTPPPSPRNSQTSGGLLSSPSLVVTPSPTERRRDVNDDILAKSMVCRKTPQASHKSCKIKLTDFQPPRGQKKTKNQKGHSLFNYRTARNGGRSTSSGLAVTAASFMGNLPTAQDKRQVKKHEMQDTLKPRRKPCSIAKYMPSNAGIVDHTRKASSSSTLPPCKQVPNNNSIGSNNMPFKARKPKTSMTAPPPYRKTSTVCNNWRNNNTRFQTRAPVGLQTASAATKPRPMRRNDSDGENRMPTSGKGLSESTVAMKGKRKSPPPPMKHSKTGSMPPSCLPPKKRRYN